MLTGERVYGHSNLLDGNGQACTFVVIIATAAAQTKSTPFLWIERERLECKQVRKFTFFKSVLASFKPNQQL